MSECDICAELADIKATLADHGDKLSILLTGVGKLVAALPPSSGYWDPAQTGSGVVLSNGNKDARLAVSASTGFNARSVTSHASGKYYAELYVPAGDYFGLVNSSFDVENDSYIGVNFNSVSYQTDGSVIENGGATAYGGGFFVNVLGFAVDITNKKLYISVDGVYEGGADPVAGTGGYSFSVVGDLYLAVSPLSDADSTNLRTDSADFTYTPPTGFPAWG